MNDDDETQARYEYWSGDHARRLRMARGLSQEQLAEASGVTPATILRLEKSGSPPSLRTITKLQRGLKLRLSAIFALLDMRGPTNAAIEDLVLLLRLNPNLPVEALHTFVEALVNSGRGSEKPPQTPFHPHDVARRFGRHVRSCRRARGLTQEKLAEFADLSCDTVRRLEHGSFAPSLTTLWKLREGLRLQLSGLFGGFELGEREVSRELVDAISYMTRDEQQILLQLVTRLWRGCDD